MSRPVLEGARVLVSGASRGIGAAIALGMAEAGADVVAASRSAEDATTDLRRRVEAAGRRFEVHRLDLADPASIDLLADDLERDGRPVDVLVNNGGTIFRAPAAEHPMAAFEHVLEVNTTGQFRLTQRLARPMLQRGRGKVLFIASLLSFQGGLNVAAYAASKSAVAGLVRALANEWAPLGVQVNGIAPGYIETDNTAALRSDPVRSRAIVERIPAGRWGRPEDLVGAAVFLASPAADYVDGVVLPVDGGWLGR